MRGRSVSDKGAVLGIIAAPWSTAAHDERQQAALSRAREPAPAYLVDHHAREFADATMMFMSTGVADRTGFIAA